MIKAHPLAQTISQSEYRHGVDHLLRAELRRVARLMRAELDAILACDLDDQYEDGEPPTVEQRQYAFRAVNEALMGSVDDAAELVNERLGSDAVDTLIAAEASNWKRVGFGNGRVGFHSGVDY